MRIFDHLAKASALDSSPAQELLRSLIAVPPRVHPKFLYDRRGCELYEQICGLSEYYPPHVEKAILDFHEQHLLELLPTNALLVDIGCGDGLKAHRWLAAGIVSRYVGVDIARDWLAECLQRGRSLFPQVQFDGVVTDLARGLALPMVTDDVRPRIFWYPGSSIGNFEPLDATRLLGEIRAHMRTGDRLVLGADGPSDEQRMRLAYDEPAGVTARFNLNVLNTINRELKADFDARWFRHRAVYDRESHRIEMHLVATRRQRVQLSPTHGLLFEEGDFIVTEHSYKYPASQLLGILKAAGFGWIDRFGIDNEGYGIFVAGLNDKHR